jgi:hypothetical protein
MGVYPHGLWLPLPENDTQPAITPRLLIFHTAVDGANTVTLRAYWNSPGVNLESHGYIRKDGTFEQYMDTGRRADANNQANGFAISVETWDGRAPDQPAVPWTDAQVAAIVAFCDWACTVHGIPRRVADRWDGSGIGWHNQFPQWSPGPTACPGQPRADQLRDVVIPALNAGPPPPPPPPGDDDMNNKRWLMRGWNDPAVYSVAPDLSEKIHMASEAVIEGHAYTLSTIGGGFIAPPAGTNVEVIGGQQVWVVADDFAASIPAVS